MKLSASFILLMLSALGLAAQGTSAVPTNIRTANTLYNLSESHGPNSFDHLYGIPLEPGRTVGDAYLDAEWRKTAFLLYNSDKLIEGYSSRYLIDRDQFEIKVSDMVKVLNGKNVRSFVWLDSLSKLPHYFVNGRDFKADENVSLSGFFEVLADGSISLLEKTEVVVKKPNYNVQFDVGHRDERILKKPLFYYVESKTVRPLPSSKKKLLEVFGEHGADVKDFMKVNAVRMDEAVHLKAVFDHYNSLIATK